MSERLPLLTAVVEAFLFVADRPLSREEIAAALVGAELEEGALEAALEELVARYDDAENPRGFRLVRLADTFQFRTTEPVSPWLREFTGLQPVRLSRAALETLAIIAYRQPCTRADVERVRGVDTGGVLRAVLERRLVRVAGRRDEAGRPNIYATTDEFLATFGLGSLADLPSLREFTMLGDEDLDAVDAALGRDPELRKQVTFEEYAARRVLAGVDAAVDDKLAVRHSEEPGELNE